MKTMLFSLLALLLLAVPAFARNAVLFCGMQPFTAQTRYMSLEGYQRWQQHRASLVWITPHRAAALTLQQLSACPPESR